MPSFTLTANQTEFDKIAVAVARVTGVSSPASGAQVKAFIIRLIQDFVQRDEIIAANETVVAAPKIPIT